MRPRVIFITGTDTGVGKTVLTGLLLSHLRQTGHHALALKPFCSGGRGDAELLHILQDGDLTLDEINPFHFKEPLAPFIAARLRGRCIPLYIPSGHIQAALEKLRTENPKRKTPPVLLIEGAGGLLSPLGEPGFNLQCATFEVQSSTLEVRRPTTYSVLDLINGLSSSIQEPRSIIDHPSSIIQVVIVAPNRLGTINHTLLTVSELQAVGIDRLTVVLMDVLRPRHSTPDTRHNAAILAELLAPIPLFPLPYLGKNAASPRILKAAARRFKRNLDRVLGGS